MASIPGRVIPMMFKKWYLIPPCLTLSNIRYVSRAKWSNPRKGVAPSPTPRCSSYWKGSLLVTLDYGCQLYFYFIIKGFQTIVFIFIVISTMFWLICPPAFFRCLSNSGAFIEFWTMSFIESTGVVCSDSVCHNWVQVLSIPVLLLACSQDWTCNL